MLESIAPHMTYEGGKKGGRRRQRGAPPFWRSSFYAFWEDLGRSRRALHCQIGKRPKQAVLKVLRPCQMLAFLDPSPAAGPNLKYGVGSSTHDPGSSNEMIHFRPDPQPSCKRLAGKDVDRSGESVYAYAFSNISDNLVNKQALDLPANFLVCPSSRESHQFLD